MRWLRTSVALAIVGAIVLVGARTPGAFSAIFAQSAGVRSADATTVDVELILAVDVSYSMDPDEQALQREGYVFALTSAEFLNALKSGIHSRIVITYFEWAGVTDQKIVVPWRLIDGAASAQGVADEIARAPYRRAYRTSISGALTFAVPLFEKSGQRGIRRVIDVSGDGTNNQGPLIVPVREETVAKGITINGLPIMLKEPQPGSIDIKDLDIYYEDCVIGGPGAFVVPIREREKFKEAARTKLVLEIAGGAGRARGAGGRRGAAHIVHHRRAHVAATLGQRDRFAVDAGTPGKTKGGKPCQIPSTRSSSWSGPAPRPGRTPRRRRSSGRANRCATCASPKSSSSTCSSTARARSKPTARRSTSRSSTRVGADAF